MKERRRKPKAVKDAKPSPQITLDAFFHKCVFEGKLKPWQQHEITAFFRNLKLREKEELKVYEETLAKY